VDEVPVVINSFLAYKETIQNCSPLTVKEYYNDLRTFFRYIIAKRGGKDLSELEQVDISSVVQTRYIPFSCFYPKKKITVLQRLRVSYLQ